MLSEKKNMTVKEIWRESFCCYCEDSQGIVQSLKLNIGLRNFSTLIGKDDLEVLGVRRWRELVIDREKWRGIVRQAKAHSGL